MNGVPLSETDRSIVNALARHGRLPNKELAEQVGIPPSTCHNRVRALEERGVIRGYRADIDPVAIGKGVSALILMSIHSHQRNRVTELTEEIREVAGVQQIFLIGGERDLVVHVACESVAELRQVISGHLASNPAFTQTQTQLVFECLPGFSPA